MDEPAGLGRYYAAFLDLSDKRCILVGGDPMALEKAEALLACGADVTVVAENASRGIEELAMEGSISLLKRSFIPADLEGAWLVVATTGDTPVSRQIFAEATARRIFANVADVPSMCTFIVPAIVRQGAIAIAISTSGTSPALAVRMKNEIAALYGADHARLAEILNSWRGWAQANLPTYEERRRFFTSIVEGDPDPILLLKRGDEMALDRVIANARASARGTPGGRS